MRRIVVLIIALLMPLGAHAAESFKASQFTGVWSSAASDSGLILNLSLLDNGTYRGNMLKGGQFVWDFSGTWSIQGRTLKFKYLTSNQPNIQPGQETGEEIMEVTADDYTVKGKGGVPRKYTRVKPR